MIDKGIRLPKIGKVKAKIHRQPKAAWIIKSATVSKDSNGKYLEYKQLDRGHYFIKVDK